MSSQDDAVPGDRAPQGDEPGAGSTPRADGDAVVDLGDRTDDGAPAANQSKTEPMPPSPSHGDPDAAPAPATVEVPDLESMNVGAGDPQAPSHPAATEMSRSGSGIAATETPVGGADLSTPGTAFRAPGSMGAAGADEQVETDVELSAARTDVAGNPGTPSGAGDASSVPVVSEEPSPGTSQESAQAQGSRTPL